jgi:hypothetical protein
VFYKLKCKGSMVGERERERERERCRGGWLSLLVIPANEVVIEEFVDELCNNRTTQPLNI